MKAHVFRETGYSPSPITAMCSNGNTIALFRRRRSLELLDSFTLRTFLTLYLDYVVLQCTFSDLNTLIILNNNNTVILIDISTLEMTHLSISATNLSAPFSNSLFSSPLFYFTTPNNHLCLFRNNSSHLILHDSSAFSFLFADSSFILSSTLNGKLSIINQTNKTTTEIQTNLIINSICAAGTNKYVAVTNDGHALLIDALNSIILDSVLVRKYSLNSVVFLDGLVHMSGADSRIISFAVGTKLAKNCQADLHTSDVLCMAVDNNRILTGGEDTVLVINECTMGRYQSQRIYDRSVMYGQSANLFYVCGSQSLDIFKKTDQTNKVDDQSSVPTDQTNKATDSIMNQTNKVDDATDRTTYKISPHILESINQRKVLYTHILRIKMKEIPTAVAISNDEKYLAYSTSNNTYLYNLYHNNSIIMDLLSNKLNPAVQLLFIGSLLIIVDYNKQISVFSTELFKIIANMECEDYRERVAVSGTDLILTYAKQIYSMTNLSEYNKMNRSNEYNKMSDELINLSDQISMLDVDGSVVDSISIDGTVVMLVKDRISQIIVTYRDGEITQRDLVGPAGNYINIGNEYCYADGTHLYINKLGRIKKYEFGPAIYGMMVFNDEIVLLQTNWKYLTKKQKASVFKEKYSNK